jgi:hypothetical protein
MLNRDTIALFIEQVNISSSRSHLVFIQVVRWQAVGGQDSVIEVERARISQLK